MIRVVKLKMVNILSHQNTELEFKQRKTQMLFGVNRDNRDRSNASGKSGIMEGLHLAFTGQPSRKLVNKKKGVVRRGENFGEIWLDLLNELTNEWHQIYWKFSASSPNLCEIRRWSGDVWKSMDDISSQQLRKDYIFEEILKMSQKDFLDIFLIFKERYVSFFQCGDAEQKNIISRISNIEKIDEWIENARAKQREKEGELTNQEKEVVGLENRIAQMNEDIKFFTQEEWEKRNYLKIKEKKEILKDKPWEKEVEKLRQKIEVSKEELESLRDKRAKELEPQKESKYSQIKEIDEVSKELHEKEEDIHAQLKDLDNSKVYKKLVGTKEEKKKARELVDEINQKISELTGNVSKMKKMLEGLVSCPACGHHFSLENEMGEEEIKEKIQQLKVQYHENAEYKEDCNKLISEIDSQIEHLNEKYKTYRTGLTRIRDEVYKDIESKRNEVKSLNREIKEIDSQIEKVKKSIKEKENEIQKMESEVNSKLLKEEQVKEELEDLINQGFNEEELNRRQEKIDNYSKNLKKDKAKVTKVKKEIEDLNQVRSIFQSFKTHLIKGSIDILNELTNHYLKTMNSELQVEISGYRTKSDGKISEKITTAMLRNYEKAGEYGSLSGGEKVTVDLAMIMARQYLVRNSSENCIDMLFTDEIIESVDQVGLRDIFECLQKLNVTSLNVTHAPLSENVPNFVLVEKNKGVSKIVRNE